MVEISINTVITSTLNISRVQVDSLYSARVAKDQIMFIMQCLMKVKGMINKEIDLEENTTIVIINSYFSGGRNH